MEAALWTVAVTVVAVAIALAVVEVVHRVIGRLGSRSVLLRELTEHAHRPFQVAVVLVTCQAAVRSSAGEFPGRAAVLHLLVLAAIAGFAWLVAALLLVSEDVALARFRTDVPDNRRARKLHTQVVMLRRVTVAGIVVLTAGVMLMTFPHVRAIGASLLASAGVIGVVAALAAQSVLGNVFAGLQLTFSDAVRLDDVVVVEGEWGRIEELTLSYVVVQIWDDRRLILPTSYFTTKPFQNWTRTRAAVLGTAEFDLDWSVPVTQMREELRRFVEGSELWDGRVCVLQVTEATGGMIQVRALVSAADAPTLWDLRCLVREHLVNWIREHHADALPRMRADVAADGAVWPALTGRPDTTAQTGTSRDGRARDGAARDAFGRDGFGRDGAARDGFGRDGAARDGFGRDGAARDAFGRDGAARDGSGRERAVRDGAAPDDDARVFGGSDDGDSRAEAFVGPDEPARPEPARPDPAAAPEPEPPLPPPAGVAAGTAAGEAGRPTRPA
ncbi:mechanosensitive ion channel [Micromonospora sp. CPCC 205371]|nr:mechanosensitive ion channel [Micromonospora sp. CPCC 205371]